LIFRLFENYLKVPTEIKNPTGILNEPDGVIYITAQSQADAEFLRWIITDKK